MVDQEPIAVGLRRLGREMGFELIHVLLRGHKRCKKDGGVKAEYFQLSKGQARD